MEIFLVLAFIAVWISALLILIEGKVITIKKTKWKTKKQQ